MFETQHLYEKNCIITYVDYVNHILYVMQGILKRENKAQIAEPDLFVQIHTSTPEYQYPCKESKCLKLLLLPLHMII